MDFRNAERFNGCKNGQKTFCNELLRPRWLSPADTDLETVRGCKLERKLR
jgi:hypothetical protein